MFSDTGGRPGLGEFRGESLSNGEKNRKGCFDLLGYFKVARNATNDAQEDTGAANLIRFNFNRRCDLANKDSLGRLVRHDGFLELFADGWLDIAN